MSDSNVVDENILLFFIFKESSSDSLNKSRNVLEGVFPGIEQGN